MALTAAIKEKIVRKLFADAETLGWHHMNIDQRSGIYAQWMEDDEVGGRLAQFMPLEKARLWIKDGPMKEYARSRYGVGQYADYVPNPAAGVADLVRRSMGSDWEIVHGSRKVKPLRVLIRRGEKERWFTWTSSEHLKHLVWAAVKAEALGDPTPWVLCLVGSFEKPIPADQRAVNHQIGARCQLEIVHVDDL